MKKFFKNKWDRLQPCEKRATVVVGVITAVCLVTTAAIDLYEMKNGGAN
jgi:hypothetical protein